MVLASENDILATISDDEIIDTFAPLSTRLRNNLACLINNTTNNENGTAFIFYNAKTW